MIISIGRDLTDFLSEHGCSSQQLLIELYKHEVRIDVEERYCSCREHCGFLLGAVSCGYYVNDVWVWELERYQWWPDAQHEPEEARLDAIERLVRKLAHLKLVAQLPDANHVRERMER